MKIKDDVRVTIISGNVHSDTTKLPLLFFLNELGEEDEDNAYLLCLFLLVLENFSGKQ